jgi:hypothetical protein
VTIAFRDDDVSKLFADSASIGLAVPIVIDGHAGTGYVEENDQVVVTEAGRGEIVAGVTVVTIQTSAFPAGSLKPDKAITVDGNSYTIREKLKTGDAALTKILLGSV